MVLAGRVTSFNNSNSYWGLSSDEIKFIEDILDEVPEPIKKLPHHDFIKKSFIYVDPVPPAYAGRFKPPGYNLNVFYGSCNAPTSLHEAAYYFLKERVGRPFSGTPEKRLAITVEIDESKLNDARSLPNIANLIDKNNYYFSHQFYISNQPMLGVIYPSCRFVHPTFPNTNYAVMDINLINPQIINHDFLTFEFLSPDKCRIKNISGKITKTIDWPTVS